MSKYHSRKVELDGYLFDSAAEARRYGELRLLERAGELTALQPHPYFDLVVDGLKVCRYEGDFSYFSKGGRLIVEDVKGVRTPVYRLKKRLMKAVLGIDITEVEA